MNIEVKMEDLYAILGVSKKASADEIKKQYRKLAQKYHPDLNPGDRAAEERFKSISAAYSILGDEAKRKDYDFQLENPFQARNYANQATSSQDPFWEWFNQEAFSQKNRGYTQYTWSTNNAKNDKNEQVPLTRAEAVSLFLRGLFSMLLGLFFFRISFILIPFGPLLCILGIAKGVSNAARGIKDFFLSFKVK